MVRPPQPRPAQPLPFFIFSTPGLRVIYTSGKVLWQYSPPVSMCVYSSVLIYSVRNRLGPSDWDLGCPIEAFDIPHLCLKLSLRQCSTGHTSLFQQCFISCRLSRNTWLNYKQRPYLLSSFLSQIRYSVPHMPHYSKNLCCKEFDMNLFCIPENFKGKSTSF